MSPPKLAEPGLVTRLAVGAIAGAAATMAFVAAARRIQPQGSRFQPDLATLAYGAVAGGVLLAIRPNAGRLTGLTAGGGLWLAGETGILPSLTIRAASGSVPSAAARLIGHLAWGWSVTEAIRDAETLRAALTSRLT